MDPLHNQYVNLGSEFLPVSAEDMQQRNWESYDFLYINGDAYVDHPSFGAAIISRMLESRGFRVCMLAQPDVKDLSILKKLGPPRLAALISAGNIDSMVASYTAARRRRSEDFYSPGKKAGLRPDRALNAYTKYFRSVYPDIPVIIGGLEASLRRFAHYDYWDDAVRPSALIDSGADILSYGMGELSITEIAEKLDMGFPVSKLTNIRGTCFISSERGRSAFEEIECAPFEKCGDKLEYAKACRLQYREADFTSDKAIIQRHGDKFLVQNPPARPLTTSELDGVYALPYTRRPHPCYDALGGVPSINEVEFSITHVRGCFGGCNFCSLTFHQGRIITPRSHESVIAEAVLLTKLPGFKGYIHDVGGPTANFRAPACEKQLKAGACRDRSCLTPKPCPNLRVDHSDYRELLAKLRALPGIKKVFIRSGIRFDYLMADRDRGFFNDLVRHHISGQLKVAPEHCTDNVLAHMNKPSFGVYREFKERYEELNRRLGLKQYLVPYLMSSHPGSTLSDAVELAAYLNSQGVMPEQVQDFYPTPGSISTCMFYTGLDPRTLKPVYVARDPAEKAMQRALLQWRSPQNRELVIQALKKVGRTDLIGTGKNALVRPEQSRTESAKGRNAQKSNYKGRR
ncbi:MAG: YgiQ family radical SAM protein [Clostridia bacterium]|nr:YgiQ family radical SAM protein [Clostridia bacterium]